MLLVRGRHVAGPFEQHPRRVAAAERATKAEFEIFEALDGFRAEVVGRARVLEVFRVRQLAEVVDGLVELLRRNAVLCELLAKGFGVGEALRRFFAELLRVIRREALALERAAARNAARIRIGSAISELLAVAHALALLSLLPLLPLTLALPLTLLAALLSFALLALLTALSLLSLLALLLSLLSLPLLSLLTTLLTLLTILLLLTLLSLAVSLTLGLLLAILKAALIALRSTVLLLTVLLASLLSVLLLSVLLLAILLAAGLLLTVLLLSVLLATGLLLAVLLLAVLLALAAGRAVLFRTLTHAFVHRLEPAHEIARLVSRLRVLTLRVVSLRRSLRLLQTLTEISDITGDLLLRLIHPVGRRVARLLLRVSKLLFDLATANRVGRVLQRA
jgi:hypothetical protein